MSQNRDCFTQICFFCSSRFVKDVENLEKDKNCTHIDVYKEILSNLLKTYLSGIRYFEWQTEKVRYVVKKLRLKHPCIKKGKRGGLRLFYAFVLTPQSSNNFLHIVLLRVILKSEKENLSKDEIIEVLKEFTEDEVYQLVLKPIE